MTVEAFMAQADADRQQRERAWEDFVIGLRLELQRHGLVVLLQIAATAYTRAPGSCVNFTPTEGHIRDFAAAHGWPDTLRAVAQAMDADERERRELMDRR